MATYKVLQDIEAEDKLVGPLTLRQFIYAGITALCLYISFILFAKGLPFLIPLFLLPGTLTGFFAYPFGRDQPTEIWALAKIRFLVKPRKRVWNQSGVKELVTVTAPKRIEITYTNGLSQFEVHSRLRALADTIDSRGWAVKDATGTEYNQPAFIGGQGSDRLIDLNTLPQEVPYVDTAAERDMLDDADQTAQTFDAMIHESDRTHRQQIMQTMSTPQSAPTTPAPQLPAPQVVTAAQPPPAAPANNYWFMGQPALGSTPQAQVVSPGTPPPSTAIADEHATAEEKALAERLRRQNNSQEASYAHLHTILPLSEQQALAKQAAQAAAAAKTAQAPMTHQPDPAIIALATNNDLNVATIAREARKQTQEPPDEVIISLH